VRNKLWKKLLHDFNFRNSGNSSDHEGSCRIPSKTALERAGMHCRVRTRMHCSRRKICACSPAMNQASQVTKAAAHTAGTKNADTRSPSACRQSQSDVLRIQWDELGAFCGGIGFREAFCVKCEERRKCARHMLTLKAVSLPSQTGQGSATVCTQPLARETSGHATAAQLHASADRFPDLKHRTWMGALASWAPSTRRTICASVVSAPVRLTRTCSTPPPFTEPVQGR